MALVIVNPVCGDKSAPAFFNDHVLPLLKDKVDSVEETSSPEHAGAVVVERLTSTEPLTVVLGSGDGTLHDIINALYNHRSSLRPVNFVLVPCGTANALYASLFTPNEANKLLSLHAFLDNKPPVPLSLATTTISSQVSVSSVVVSTSLHASILHDSEALRATHPGIARFKIAAQQNSTKWYSARVRLSAPVQLYDPRTRAFAPGPSELVGPFVYFLATLNVDRLEPAFRIAPLTRAVPSTGTCDLVVVRPLRDPSITEDTPAARAAFAAKTWAVLGAAYQDGAHIDLSYSPEGEVVAGTDGPPIVEYIRCTGWEWIPDAADPDAHLVCTDGAISRIPAGGSAVCAVDAFPHALAVYA